MKVAIDRFEGSYGVCEADERKMIDIEKNRIPSGAKEGDVLNIVDDIIPIDIYERQKRRKKVEKLTKKLWKSSE